MNSPSVAADFRPDVNALRALAVLAVIAFHFGLPGASAGYLGVDVFFVISGYLIGGQIAARLEAGRFSLTGFFAGRIRRIVPALAVTCAAVLAWGWSFLLPGDYKALARSALNTLAFFSNRYFDRQIGYFDLGAAYKPLLHTWSLSIEGQFYLLLPLVLMAAWKLPRRLRIVAVALIAGASLAAAIAQGRTSAEHVFFSFSARAWEFLVGGAVAWFVEGRLAARRPGRARTLFIGVAWATLAAACVFIPERSVWPGAWTLVPTLLTAAIIAAGTGRSAGAMASNALVQHLGNISYSLYLWHWAILVCWRLTFLADPAPQPPVLALIALTWALAALSWRFVEQPLRRHPMWARPRRLFAGYAASLLLAVAFAQLITKTDGLSARLPPYLAGADAAARSEHPLAAGCWDLPGDPAPSHYACDLGDPRATPPSFVIWGDSHALQYLEALRAQVHGKAAGYLFHRPGCEPAIEAAAAGPGCDQHNAQVLRLLQDRPTIRTVVLSIRQNEASRVTRTWQMARLLSDRGYRVIFLGPLPEARGAIVQQWAAQQLRERRPIDELTMGRSEATRVASFDQRQRDWQAGAVDPRVSAFDLAPQFCDASRCWLVRGGLGLFVDADHLTHAAAAQVVQSLMPRLLNATPAGRSPV